MTTLVYPPNDRPLTTEQAATRVWTVRRLLREGAMDPLAADTALRSARRSGNLRIARLAESTTNDLVKEFAR